MSSRFHPLPAGFVPPCLPAGSKTPLSGKEWSHEIKHDGFRVVARKMDKRVKLYSRSGNDLIARNARRFICRVTVLRRAFCWVPLCFD
jgi:ATP-dependent DNA ligase